MILVPSRELCQQVQSLILFIPKSSDFHLESQTGYVPIDDVESFKKLYLDNPYILTLPEVGDGNDEIVPKNVQQISIQCSNRDKLLYILAILKLDLVQKKVLIFTNTIDTSFRLKLYLEQFGIKSAVLNAELHVNSSLHILEVEAYVWTFFKINGVRFMILLPFLHQFRCYSI
ncbi:hypothetical protein L2E82_23167 [Cichorium intybus]|uniref:Uncharacterized protein n=1 Tax=Cichorium intybus TaxID=13427 RepID=A0ACB9DZ84_CICIN|nr:hypothetical protein L2E82_23167 [Cichorium intybus]